MYVVSSNILAGIKEDKNNVRIIGTVWEFKKNNKNFFGKYRKE